MNAAYERLMQHLDDREVHYLANGETDRFVDFRGEVGNLPIIAAVDADADWCPGARLPAAVGPRALLPRWRRRSSGRTTA